MGGPKIPVSLAMLRLGALGTGLSTVFLSSPDSVRDIPSYSAIRSRIYLTTVSRSLSSSMSLLSPSTTLHSTLYTLVDPLVKAMISSGSSP